MKLLARPTVALTSLRRRIRTFAGWPRRWPQPLPAAPGRDFEVDNWVLSEFIAVRLLPLVGTRPYPLNELLLMTGAVVRLAPTHIFEWGTHIGTSARIFLETCRAFAVQAQIHSTDLPETQPHPEHPGRARGRLVRGRPGVFLHQGDGLDTSLALARQTPTGSRLLFFLDGDHAHASVRRELDGIRAAFPQAWILVHDTFDQTPDAGYNTGPHRAVQDVLAAAGGALVAVTCATGLPGMTLVVPRSVPQENPESTVGP